MSGAFTVNRDILARATTTEEVREAFGVDVLIEVRNPKAARRLFEQALSSPKLQRYRSGAGDTAGLDVPSFNNRPLRFTLDGRFLQVRSLGPAQKENPWRAHEQATVGGAHSLALGVLDPVLIHWLIFSTFDSPYDYYEQTVKLSTSVSAPDPKRQARQEELSKEIAKLEKRRSALSYNRFLRSSDTIGRIVMAAQREPAGAIAVFGSLVGTASNTGRGLQSVVESIDEDLEHKRTGTKSETQQVHEQLEKLRAERWELQNEMY